MGRSKLSLALSLLMLFILACTCGNRGKNSNANKIDINVESNDNSSNSNKPTNSNDNKTTPTTSGSETGIAECDAYMKQIDEFLNCQSVPQDARDNWRKQREEMVVQIKNMDKAFAATYCKSMTEMSKDSLKCK